MSSATRTVDTRAAEAFLGVGRLAVVGASDEKDSFGRTVYAALRDAGVPVVAVHATAETVAGDPCHPSLADVPGTVEGVVVMVAAPASVAVVREVAARGIPRIWLFRGVGTGAASEEAVRVARELGLDVVPGACPLMFLAPVGGVHRFHRGIRRLRHQVTAA